MRVSDSFLAAVVVLVIIFIILSEKLQASSSHSALLRSCAIPSCLDRGLLAQGETNITNFCAPS